MRRLIGSLLLTPVLMGSALAAQPHNVLLFVADGLRPGVVNDKTAPTMDALLKRGVRFTNTHSLFPTFTTPNASAMATGHMLGDTGDFSNTIYSGFQVPGAGDSLTPFLESDPVLGDVDEHFAGNYLNEETILHAAASQGFSTATIGKLGPALIFDHTDRTGAPTLVIDDQTGRKGGIPLSAELQAAMQKQELGQEAPTRGDNGKAGDNKTAGTRVANVQQQAWFADVATKAVLPLFKERRKPFIMVFWSRDPDGTQHNQGDSLNELTPGINGPTSLASIKNADGNLAALLATLKEQGLDKTTDVILTSDHGFSTIAKTSTSSYAATQSYTDVNPHMLPPGFVAIDIAHGLGMKLFDPDAAKDKRSTPLADGAHTSRANGLIGDDAGQPQVVVAANGGSDLIYLPKPDKVLAAKVVDVLSAQDYTSGLFVDSRLGPIPGTLPLAAIALQGSAVTPMPAIVINFRSSSTACADPTTCGVEVADTPLQQGQGMHGSFSRADTRNIMGAAGPAFKAGFSDPAPASNADLGKTIAAVTGLKIQDKGKLLGRVLTEAMPNGQKVAWQKRTLTSKPDSRGLSTVLRLQTVGTTRYFDTAGYPGRTLGLQTEASSASSRR